jgi:DNA-binding winged helix-turn-helix (wHTH) protein
MRFLFGDCVFEREARVLTREGASVHLSPKALLLLDHLLRCRPAVVSPQALRDVLWPRTIVGHNNLSQVMAELRRAIRDRRRAVIRTAYGAGYAFDGVVEQEDSVATTAGMAGCLRWGDVEIPLREGENVIGRGLECSCRIASSRVSRRHARIVVRGCSALLDDLGSKNGTHVRGRRVDAPTRLADGDVIVLGHEAVIFGAVCATDSTETDGS